MVGALLAFADRLRGVSRMLFESSSEEILCFDDSGSDAANPDSDSKCGEPLGGDSGALRPKPEATLGNSPQWCASVRLRHFLASYSVRKHPRIRATHR